MRDTSSRVQQQPRQGAFFIVLFVKQLSVRNVPRRRTALLVGENRKRQSVRQSIHRDVQQVVIWCYNTNSNVSRATTVRCRYNCRRATFDLIELCIAASRSGWRPSPRPCCCCCCCCCETMSRQQLIHFSPTPNNNSPSDNVHSLTLHSRGVEFHRIRCRQMPKKTRMRYNT
jgi:hypothetical protein